MAYSESRYDFQSAELSKLDYSGRSRIRVKLTSTPELLNAPDTPETKWLSLSADTARKVADAIIDGARGQYHVRDDVHGIADPDQGTKDTPRGVIVHVIELSRSWPQGQDVGVLALPEVPRTGDIVFLGTREFIVERAVWGSYDDPHEVDIKVRAL